MYDVQLAYMVVVHSQRDPGEYLMELQQLVRAPTEGLRRHAVDMHLGRFDRALNHLVHAGQDHFPKALQLARAKVSQHLLQPCHVGPATAVVLGRKCAQRVSDLHVPWVTYSTSAVAEADFQLVCQVTCTSSLRRTSSFRTNRHHTTSKAVFCQLGQQSKVPLTAARSGIRKSQSPLQRLILAELHC